MIAAQRNLFPDPDGFDLEEGLAMKEEGKKLAEEAEYRKEAMRIARRSAENAALRRDGTATADDAYRGLVDAGFHEDVLGNAAGSLFRGGEWSWTGRFVPSERTSNHGRMIREWRLKIW